MTPPKANATSSAANAKVSVVIPALNEQESVEELTKRISDALQDCTFELIFVDDHSTDKTVQTIQELASKYPVRVEIKEGQGGKAYSLVQGFKHAKYDIVAMIDADLQYPPEELRPMIEKVVKKEAD